LPRREKKVGILKKSMHSEKRKGLSKDSGCNLQLASLSSGNATVVDCCAAKKYMQRQLPRPNKNTKKAGCSKNTCDSGINCGRS